jgi:TolB-like protein/DNA-binding winged helix-turn-helix (wHTH) protein
MGALGRGGIFQFDGFRFDREADALFRRREDGRFVPMVLGSRALDVLEVLVGHAGELVSRDEFMAAVWPATAVEDTNLNVQIAALRRVLDEGRTDGSCIQTIPGRGYRFAVPVIQVEPCARLAAGRPSGNGAHGPTAERPEPQSPPPPGRSRNASRSAPRRQRKWLWCGSLGLTVGAIGLLAAAVTASNWHPPRFEATRPAPRLSIIVLPFTDLGDDREAHDLANGLTEDLSTDLSSVPDFLVTSRHTAFTYGNKLVDTKQIGRELAVRYVLDGTVQRSGNQLRINAQLVDAETDTQLWAERFEREAGDLSALQNEITNRIAIALNAAMLTTEANRSNDHPDALGYVLQARAIWLKPRNRDNFAKAVRLLEHALELDPSSIEAQAQLGQALVTRTIGQMTLSPAADIDRAKSLIERALAAMPWHPEGHFAKAQLRRLEGRCDEAIAEYEMAIALYRHMVPAYRNLADCKLFTGSIAEAISVQEQAIRMSLRGGPMVGYMYWRVGTAYLLLSHVDTAIVWFEKARSAEPAAALPRLYLASAYALNGKTERAASELAEAHRLSADDRYSSLARLKAIVPYWGMPKVRSLFEATYFAGLRKAGMPEE